MIFNALSDYNQISHLFLFTDMLRRGLLNTTLCDQICQWHAAGLWFSRGTPVSSTNKTDSYDITEILSKVALNTITLTTLLVSHGMKDRKKTITHITHMRLTLRYCPMKIVLTWLCKGYLKLNCFVCYEQSDWSKSHSMFIISLNIHQHRVTCRWPTP